MTVNLLAAVQEELLRRAAGAEGRVGGSDQEVVPQARPQIPPGQEPQQRGGHQALCRDQQWLEESIICIGIVNLTIGQYDRGVGPAAYEVLTDQEKRKIYDRYGEEGLKQFQGGRGGGGGMNIQDIFSRLG